MGKMGGEREKSKKELNIINLLTKRSTEFAFVIRAVAKTEVYKN